MFSRVGFPKQPFFNSLLARRVHFPFWARVGYMVGFLISVNLGDKLDTCALRGGFA